jgi:hypothetical protein
MSLFGKILALLNIFGALALVYLAMMDYGKRQAWAYSYFRHELVYKGLPLNGSGPGDPDGHETANKFVVEQLGEELPREIFGTVGGNPVTTQVQEVERVQAILDAKLQTAQAKPNQCYLLARILMPLADHYLEREQLLACQAHLGTQAGLAALEKRCEEAARSAVRPVAPMQPERPFADAFRLSFHAQGGEPAEYLVSLLLTKLVDDKGKPTQTKVHDALLAAIDAQHASLDLRYQQLFTDARGTADKTKSDAPASTAAQRAAVARLLFGLSVFLAEEEILTDPSKEAIKKGLLASPTRSAYQTAIIESDPYKLYVKRTYAVCGVEKGLEAISERAAVLRSLSGYVQDSFGQERLVFLFDHAAIIEQLREQGGVVREEESRIAGNKQKLADFDQVVRLRTKEIADLEADLKKSREETAKEIAKLRGLSEGVLQLRLDSRDAIRDNELGEKKIRELEKKVRELERSR